MFSSKSQLYQSENSRSPRKIFFFPSDFTGLRLKKTGMKAKHTLSEKAGVRMLSGCSR